MAPKSQLRGGMRQEKVFYMKEWTEEIDRTFLRGLAEQSVSGNPVNNGPNKNAIRSSMHRVNKIFNTNFDYSTCLDRFQKLRKRYDVYTWIIGLPGVTFEPLSYDIICRDYDWDYIYRGDPLAMAYMNKGERDYHTLKYIFDDRDLPILRDVNGNEIIQISSDHTGYVSTTNTPGEDEQTTNVFCNEIAWYNSGTDGEASENSSYYGSHQSSNVNVQSEWNRNTRHRATSSYEHCSSGPSSVTSSSPFKKK